MNADIDYSAEYDNSSRVENSSELIDKFITDADNYRDFAAERIELDLSYGDRDRNRMDIIWPDSKSRETNDCPMVMFIHGGYWQRMDRSCFSHLSAGLNAHGIAVAMPSYTLCPNIKIDGIITEMRRASLVLYQTYRRRITVVGHSAGGHLAACVMATNWPKIHHRLPHDLIASGLGISGLYDLVPLCQTPINEALGMTEQDARDASPVKWIPEAMQRFDAWVGEEESSEFHRQSRELASHWSLLGTPTRYVSVPGANHFTVVDELVRPDSPMIKRLLDLVKQPMTEANLVELDEDDIRDMLQQFAGDSPADDAGSSESESDTSPDTLDDGESGSARQPEDQTSNTADDDDSEEEISESELGYYDDVDKDASTDEPEDGTQEGVKAKRPARKAQVAQRVTLKMPKEALVEPDLPDSPKQEPEQPAEADQADAAAKKQTE